MIKYIKEISRLVWKDPIQAFKVIGCLVVIGLCMLVIKFLDKPKKIV